MRRNTTRKCDMEYKLWPDYMSRLNCSAIPYVQLLEKLPSVILSQLTCKTLLVRRSIARETSSQ